MLRFALRTSGVLAVFVGLSVVLGAAPLALAQDAPPTAPDATATDATATDATLDDNAPVVPDKPFPSLLALGEGDLVWTLKVSNSTLKVNGDVAVNSLNQGAIWMANGAIEAKGTVSVVGGVSRLGRTSIQPLAAIGAHVVSDPLPGFSVAPPENVISREKLFLHTEAGGDDTLLPPGIYDGGIFASGDGHITLQPGVFVVTNGDFSVIGPTVEGEGVTIVMAGAHPGALGFSLGARFNASAPTSGKLKGLLVISRASGQLTTGVSFAVAQGRMKGLLYVPTAAVSVQSQARVQVSRIIAKSVEVSSGSLEVTGSVAEPVAANATVAAP